VNPCTTALLADTSEAAAIGGAPQGDAELELVSHFVRTGTVPWWADLSDRALLEANLEGLIRRAPQALRRALQAAPDQERMLRRIARTYPDRLLDDLAGVMAPSLSAFPPGWGAAWTSALESASGAPGYTGRALRSLWREEVLRAASAGGAPVAEAPRFFQAVLTRVARRLGIEYRLLLADLRRGLEDAALAAQPWVRDVAENLWRELAGDSMQGREPALPDESVRTGLIALLPAHLQAEAIAALQGADSRASGSEVLSSATIAALAALVRAALEQQLVAPGVVEAYAARIRQAAPPGMSPAACSELRAKLLDALRRPAALEREEDAPIDSRFSDADEVYVENAGLVILWPFLVNFFTRLGLAEEKAFKNAAAMQRAVGLLQHLATGEAPEPEYLLPLNKLLCGMPLEEVFDFGEPITDAEIEACADLLGAAIHQAPILRDMSIPGFRASFLLRKGQLGSRDGNWLLRVERETHDIVLDRFPWSVHLVKLPWMQAMMQVEW
jgi:hypothetical protein